MEIKKTNIKLSVGEGCNGVLLKNLYLSCDPYMRTRMKKLEEGSYIIESFTPGSPITGLGVAKVLESVDSNFQKGDLVWGMTGWEEYSIVTDTQSLLKIHDKDVPLSYYTGILGTPGLTAYAGFYEVCSPKREKLSLFPLLLEQLVSLLANLQRCLVAMLLVVLEPKRRYFPDGIDIYFENVGGKMLDVVLVNMKLHGRTAVRGMISQYNLEQTEGVHNLFCLITKRIRMEGFIVPDYDHLCPKYSEMIITQIKAGKVVYVEDVAEGLERAPSALVGLFSGRKIGKQVVVVSRE